MGDENTLLHRETLLVVSARDAEDVSLELVAEGVSGYLLGHLFVIEDTETTFIVNIDGLLLARRRVGDVELHVVRSLEAVLCERVCSVAGDRETRRIEVLYST